MHPSVKLFLIVAVFKLLLLENHQCEGRYLPTRGRGDNLEKLRELMYQILESSNENTEDKVIPNGRVPWSKQSLLDSSDFPQTGSSRSSRYNHNSLDNGRFY